MKVQNWISNMVTRGSSFYIIVFSSLAILVSYTNCAQQGLKVSDTNSTNASSVSAPSSCAFNGQVVSDGSVLTAYQSATVLYGQSCQSQVRLCTSGVLSGSYTFSNCSVLPPVSCNFNGAVVSNAATVTAYQAGSVPFGSTCTSETRTCSNGILNGSFTFANCAVGSPASCNFNGQTLASGGTANGFTAATVPYGSLCSSVATTVTCNNGALSPATVFASCSVTPPANCTFNNQPLASGASINAFTAASVPYGSLCSSVATTVSCTNGVLSPTNAVATCSVTPPLNCTFNNQSLASGASINAFTAASVPYGSLCSSVATTVSCTNGVLSPANAVAACTVQPAQLANVTQIQGGSNYFCALNNTGNVYCWGGNSYGQLGNGTFTDSMKPVQVTGLSSVSAISAKGQHTCAQQTTRLACWGNNASKQLGNGTFANSNLPVTTLPIGGPNFNASYFHFSADYFSTISMYPGFVFSSGLAPNIGAGVLIEPLSTWPNTKQLSTNKGTVCFLSNAGTIRCAGYNANGELANGNTADSEYFVNIPGISNATSMAMEYNVCALLSTGGIKCWGVDKNGKILLPTTITDANNNSINTFKSISIDNGHGCGATTDGHVKCWRTNEMASVYDIPGISNVKDVATGMYADCALTNDGHVGCWFDSTSFSTTNDNGQLGNTSKIVNSFNGEYVPVP